MKTTTSYRATVMRGVEFEDLVADLFTELGYSVQRDSRIGGMGIDLVLLKEGLTIPVEVSAVSSQSAMAKLRADAERLASLIETTDGLSKPIIVIGSDLTPAAKTWSENQFHFHVWDMQELIRQAAPYPEIKQRLQDYRGDVSKPTLVSDPEIDRLRNQVESHIENNTLTPAEYEALCMAVFTKLFDPHLYGFQKQARTSDGGNRYDFICRIKSGNAFWDGIRQDFRTKAILFECKNYELPIGPDQVYSTERYLFSGALRTVCILVARLGAAESAVRAAQGAMRESGKLIILLSNRDLIEMLQLSTQEGGPEDFLDKRIWDFIISLPR